MTPEAHADAAHRAAAAVRELRSAGWQGEFLGSSLVPADEVAYYRFAAETVADVEHVGEHAGLPFDRILEYVEPASPM